MHKDTLTQKKLFQKRIFGLTEMGVKITEQGSQNNSETVTDYDQIGFRLSKYYGPGLISLYFVFGIITVLFGTWILFTQGTDNKIVVAVLFTAVIIFSALISFLRMRKQQKVIRVEGGSVTINFWMDTPSKEAVEGFIAKLFENSREYYKKKYAVIEKHLSAERHMNNFLFLRDMGAIDQKEYEKLCKKLDEGAQPIGIGFKE